MRLLFLIRQIAEGGSGGPFTCIRARSAYLSTPHFWNGRTKSPAVDCESMKLQESAIEMIISGIQVRLCI